MHIKYLKDHNKNKVGDERNVSDVAGKYLVRVGVAKEVVFPSVPNAADQKYLDSFRNNDSETELIAPIAESKNEEQLLKEIIDYADENFPLQNNDESQPIIPKKRGRKKKQ